MEGLQALPSVLIADIVQRLEWCSCCNIVMTSRYLAATMRDFPAPDSWKDLIGMEEGSIYDAVWARAAIRRTIAAIVEDCTTRPSRSGQIYDPDKRGYSETPFRAQPEFSYSCQLLGEDAASGQSRRPQQTMALEWS